MTGGGPRREGPWLETSISYLLITGVSISLLLEVAGVVLFYRAYGDLAVSQDPGVFISGSNFFSFMWEQLKGGQGSWNAVAFMTAGVVVLVLTPYLRVIASVVYFAWQKDIKYVLITCFVLAAVTLSLALH